MNDAKITEYDLYKKLLPNVLSDYQMVRHGYPIEDPLRAGMRKAPYGVRINEKFSPPYSCKRCKQIYNISPADGTPIMLNGICVYHPGSVWYKELNGQYSCCKRFEGAKGCSSNVYHVNEYESELENFQGYVKTQPAGRAGDDCCKVFAIDCEMCFTTLGLELTQVTLINYKQEVVYETLVKPQNPILDYNTVYSGIKKGDLDNVKVTLADVQRDLLRLIPAESILIGHGLDSDMNELKIFHKNFIDTAALFPHRRGLPYKKSLKNLAMEKLGRLIQADRSGHDSAEDARAAFRLVMWYLISKLKYDDPIRSWYSNLSLTY